MKRQKTDEGKRKSKQRRNEEINKEEFKEQNIKDRLDNRQKIRIEKKIKTER